MRVTRGKRKATPAAAENGTLGDGGAISKDRKTQQREAEAPDDPPSAREPATPTPATAAKERLPRQQHKARKLSQDIGLPTLLLGGGAEVEEVAAATDQIDHLPLASAGFTKASLHAASDYLAKRDPKLAAVIKQHGAVPDRLLRKTGSNFATLAKAIVFQQLATNAAATIYGRVLKTCDCVEMLTPEALLAVPLSELRMAGLSERKASYMLDLAHHFSDGRLTDEMIGQMDEEALEKALCAVRGIGIWTVHMHSMFHLGSPDVLPTGDLGVRRGMQQLYGLKELPNSARMEAISECWRPFRSLGAYFMWKVDVPRSTSTKKSKKA